LTSRRRSHGSRFEGYGNFVPGVGSYRVREFVGRGVKMGRAERIPPVESKTPGFYLLPSDFGYVVMK
jgi:hypothetical protein